MPHCTNPLPHLQPVRGYVWPGNQVPGINKFCLLKATKTIPLARDIFAPKPQPYKMCMKTPTAYATPCAALKTAGSRLAGEEAFDEAVAGIETVQAQYGRHAVGIYLGNPNVHNWGNLLFGPPTIPPLRTKHRFSATSADQLPQSLCGPLYVRPLLSHPRA